MVQCRMEVEYAAGGLNLAASSFPGRRQKESNIVNSSLSLSLSLAIKMYIRKHI